MAMKFKHMAMACLEFNCGYILDTHIKGWSRYRDNWIEALLCFVHVYMTIVVSQKNFSPSFSPFSLHLMPIIWVYASQNVYMCGVELVF